MKNTFVRQCIWHFSKNCESCRC